MAKKPAKMRKEGLKRQLKETDKSRRLSNLTQQPNPPRRSVKSGRKGQK